MPIIQRSLVYPVILDARRTVLSLPPVINGAHSAVRLYHSSSTRGPQTLCRMAWQAEFVPPAAHIHCQTVNSLLQGSDVRQGCSERYCACFGAAVKRRTPYRIA